MRTLFHGKEWVHRQAHTLFLGYKNQKWKICFPYEGLGVEQKVWNFFRGNDNLNACHLLVWFMAPPKKKKGKKVVSMLTTKSFGIRCYLPCLLSTRTNKYNTKFHIEWPYTLLLGAKWGNLHMACSSISFS